MSVAEVPRPPEDAETRNIIDKLAQFVAKNGQEFEEMTKVKQKDNPKFSFLYGGPCYHYYQYRVSAEQAILKKQQQQSASALIGGGVVSAAASAVVPAAQQHQSSSAAQIQALEQKILESEKNLAAQWEVLTQQQNAQIDSCIQKAEAEKVVNYAAAIRLNLDEFGHLLDALIASCTKEAISSSKSWIFKNCESERAKEIILAYMLNRVTEGGATQEARLHVLYLLNDWAHHCHRKKQEGVTQMLSRYVPKMYAFAVENVRDGAMRNKLDKLMDVWETHKYFDDNAYKVAICIPQHHWCQTKEGDLLLFQQLRNPGQVYQSVQQTQKAEYQAASAEVVQRCQTTYQQYQKQHMDYVRHVRQQIQTLQTIQMVQQQAGGAHPPPPSLTQTLPNKRKSRFDATDTTPQQASDAGPRPPVWRGGPGPPPPPVFGGAGPFSMGPGPRGPWGGTVPMGGQWPPPPPAMPPYGAPVVPQQNAGHRTLLGMAPANSGPFPHGSAVGVQPQQQQQSTPSQAAAEFDESKLIPKVPYYDLPAGLMIPMVKLEDHEYEPLDAKQLRLPPPMPPSERLLAAVEAFYSPPSHENPRDAEGWEKLGLYEYQREKAKAIEKERQRRRSSSGSSSSSPPDKKATGRRRRSASSSASSASGSRSSSPAPTPPLPPPQSSSRSATGESTEAGRLGDHNKGYQMLEKMGWAEGRGLGAEGTGRQEPVEGGEVRRGGDVYKGVGVTTEDDPYEQFRKQRSEWYSDRVERSTSNRKQHQQY